ncbi:PPK2 family polyphosphate kinase [Dactylosporangium sp. NPDC049140]|jgi:PPK2 family polyphosphate:nucleotide phosphotransferase|uniref:PPK2 family polyphosphate kinase n=1 Tax=Dactylosporangium sp. NPDC049140 TaxID=3155647 RepID=UPI0033E8959F
MPKHQRDRIAELIAPLRVEPGRRVRLPRDFDPGYTGDLVHKRDGAELLERGVALLADHQARLAAEGTRGVLVVLQALDAGGKDGTIRHVMSGVNPQGVRVHSFKVPSAEERAHDYLWRYSLRLPARGEIAIFNRSHYEEVLVVRVHDPEAPASHWRDRFRAINNWEHHVAASGFHIVKLFLNLSPEEQRRRLLARIDEPAKNWKFSASDLAERQHWDDYQRAYADLLSHTSTDWAPWHVIPADQKWFARIAAAAVIADTLMAMDPRYPTLDRKARRDLKQFRGALEDK